MELLTEDRAQALQVGAVLLFGILVILFTVWQAFVIPDQNERVEFSHNQQVQSEMVELRGNIVSTADATTPASGSVKLGAQFPNRLLFVNPSPAAGTLQTESVGDGESVIENAVAASNESGERLFWNGSRRAYETISFKYTPDYRVFQGAPATVYDNSVTYNVFQSQNEGSSALSEQAVIDGDTITLVTLVGEYAESGITSVTPDITPVSTRSRSVAVENTSGGNITLELPTQLNETQWNSLLEEEENVVDVSSPSNETVEIELAEGQYELRMAQVGVGEGLVEPRPAYIEEIDGGNERISPNQNHSVTVEVRDRFNVPKTNINITGSVDPGKGEIRPEDQTTNVDGQATFEYEPAGNLSANETVELTFEETNPGTFEDDGVDNVTVNVTVQGAGFSPGPGNGSDTFFTIEWIDAGGDFQDENGNECEPQQNDTCYLNPNVGGNVGTLTANATAEDGTPVSDIFFISTNREAGNLNTTNSSINANGNATLEINAVMNPGGNCVNGTAVVWGGGGFDTLDYVVGPTGACTP